MTEMIAFTVRLYGKDLKFYKSYKSKLEEEIPNVSHSQTIASMIKKVEKLGVSA